MRVRSNHTQSQIVAQLRRAGGLSRIQSLADALDVSEQTVRRNLKRLAEDGLVESVHGGARLLEHDPTASEGDLHQRLAEHPEAKRRIARHVASMIDDGASLFLDIGSTAAFIADALRDHRRLLVVTNSVRIAWKLSMRNENRVFMAGGELRASDGGVFGAGAMAFADNFSTDFAILSVAGVDAERGFTLFDLEEAHFWRRISSRADERIVAADSSKFGREAPISAGDPVLVDHLISERAPPPDIDEATTAWGIRTHVAR